MTDDSKCATTGHEGRASTLTGWFAKGEVRERAGYCAECEPAIRALAVAYFAPDA